MKKLITIIIISLSFYSCEPSFLEDISSEEIKVVFDMQDNIVNYDNQGWVINLNLENKERVNEVSLERTDYGFMIRSFYKCDKLILVTGSEKYSVDYTNGHIIKVTNKYSLDNLFYWNEVIELKLTLFN